MKKSILIIMLSIIATSAIFAQKNITIEKPEKKLVIDSVSAMLIKSYISEEVAKKMVEFIKKNFESGNYKSISDPQEFGTKLTEDLQSISNDLHLMIGFAPDQIKSVKEAKIDKNELLITKVQEKLANYGFAEVKNLPQGVGYLKLNSFIDSPEARDVAAGAMSFLSNSGAVIIDLRENYGGDPEMVQFLLSYFFGDNSLHLNTFYIRESNTTKEFWTFPSVPGKKLVNTELYIITSNQSFSAAEEFAYDLKNMKRATIIGETTAGAAHPVDMKIINSNYAMLLPIGKPINPITKTNWEGIGVEPDIRSSSDKAFDVAYLTALKSLMEKEADEKIKAIYSYVIEKIKVIPIDTYNNQKINTPDTLDEKSMQAYVGLYGPRKIFYENGGLVYQREKRAKQKMVFIKKDIFELGEDHSFQLVFIWEGDKVVAVEGHYDDGRVTRNERGKNETIYKN